MLLGVRYLHLHRAAMSFPTQKGTSLSLSPLLGTVAAFAAVYLVPARLAVDGVVWHWGPIALT